MAEIRPFRGIRYSQEIVRDLASVICPPYDVVGEEQRSGYEARSVYNAIHLECPAPMVATEAGQHSRDRYRRAASTFRQWLREGILGIEPRAAFYLHDHYFTHLGKRRRRRGLIACVRLQPWYDGIYPHEETLCKAKSERLELMRACRANFSPLLALYQDVEGKIAGILSQASRERPVVELSESSERDVVWVITEGTLAAQISELMAGQSVYIADGHHRYETALTYEMERAASSLAEEEASQVQGFNYVMMTLVDFSDPGVLVFPVHRLVYGVETSLLAGLENRLKDVFVLEYVPLTGSLGDSVTSGMPDDVVAGILGLRPGCLVVMRSRQDVSLEDLMPQSRSQVYRDFNVSVVDDLVLGGMLGLARDSDSVVYSGDTCEVCERIKDGRQPLAFLFGAPQLKMLKAIAEARDRVPRKSTYFWPKLPTGLVMNSLEALER